MDKCRDTLPPIWLLSLMFGLLPMLWVPVSEGQTTAITSSGLNTTVTPGSIRASGGQNYKITGGTRPGGGTNLFHSFGEFSVGSNDGASFVRDSGLATTNILSRVTGGNTSQIYGEISTVAFPGANLYLFNPAGVAFFGPTARLNVSGSVKVSTADYLRLADGIRFNAVPGAEDALLSAKPVTEFGFLKFPGAISVQFATLETAPGTSLSFVGGDIAIVAESSLRTNGGKVELISVNSPGVVHTSSEPEAITSPQLSGFEALGDITIRSSSVRTRPPVGTARNSGPIEIRGGRLEIVNATLEAGTSGQGQPGSITLQLSDSIQSNRSQISSSIALGQGRGGAVSLEAGKVMDLLESEVRSDGGTIVIDTIDGNVDLRNTVIDAFNSAPEGQAEAGTISITAGRSVSFDVADVIAAGDQGGNVVIEAGGRVNTLDSLVSAASDNGNGGNIIIKAPQLIDLRSTEVETPAGGPFVGGNIDLSSNLVRVLGSSRISSTGVRGPGGNITITTDNFVSQTINSVDASSQFGGSGSVSIGPPPSPQAP